MIAPDGWKSFVSSAFEVLFHKQAIIFSHWNCIIWKFCQRLVPQLNSCFEPLFMQKLLSKKSRCLSQNDIFYENTLVNIKVWVNVEMGMKKCHSRNINSRDVEQVIC